MRAVMAGAAVCRSPSHDPAYGPLRGVKGALRRAAPALDPAPGGRYQPLVPAVHLSVPTGNSFARLDSAVPRYSPPPNSARHSGRKSLRQLQCSHFCLALIKERKCKIPVLRETTPPCFPLNSGGHNSKPGRPRRAAVNLTQPSKPGRPHLWGGSGGVRGGWSIARL